MIHFSKKLFALTLGVMTLLSCQRDPLKVDTSRVSIDMEFARFDRVFLGTPAEQLPAELPQIQEDFPEFFLTGQTDQEWIAVHQDPLLVDLYAKVADAYPDLEGLRPDITSILRHRNYYYPMAPSKARVITYISGLDWEYPIIAADSLYFIGLDLFLGPDSSYGQFPRYIAARFSPEYLAPKFARQLAEPLVTIQRQSTSFLTQMIYEGRVLYLMEAFMPDVEKHLIMEYTPEELNWCEENEEEIWTFFVEGELLFSNDNGLYDRFIAEAPFSKFFKKVDQESPGRIGRWLGWQIVRSYMAAHPETTLPELAQMSDAQELFKNAQYKPFQ